MTIGFLGGEPQSRFRAMSEAASIGLKTISGTTFRPKAVSFCSSWLSMPLEKNRRSSDVIARSEATKQSRPKLQLWIALVGSQ
jgi:hypothetical protein